MSVTLDYSRLRLVGPFLGILFLTGCLDPNEPALSMGSARQEQITFNSLVFDAFKFNALSTNPQGIPLLLNQSLSDAVTDPYLQEQLLDPFAHSLFSYLVSCALDPAQSVTWSDGTPEPVTVSGSLGLCTQWHTNPVANDPACLELVSACLLARNNPLGVRVPLSLRGVRQDETTPLAVSSAPMTMAPAAAPSESLSDCTPAGAAIAGTERNCGWDIAGYGTCVQGTPVVAGAACSGSDMMMRICDGADGCNHDDALASQEDACNDTVSFSCAGSELFTIMVAPVSADAPGGPDDMDIWTDNASYPLRESDFRIREGAFFGNMLDGERLDPHLHVYVQDTTVFYRYRPSTKVPFKDIPIYQIPLDRSADERLPGRQAAHDAFLSGHSYEGTVYQGMYACSAEHWDESQAYGHDRLCATAGGHEHCAAQWVGTCENLCGTDDSSVLLGDGDYDDCLDTGSTSWHFPVTVYLARAP